MYALQYKHDYLFMKDANIFICKDGAQLKSEKWC